MKLDFDQSDYCNRVASQKIFNHELNIAWLQACISPAAAILDYGCGYGRLIRELSDHGHHQVPGMDSVAEMIELGKIAWD